MRGRRSLVVVPIAGLLAWFILWITPHFHDGPLPRICLMLNVAGVPPTRECLPGSGDPNAFLQRVSDRWVQTRIPLRIGQHAWEPQLGRIGAQFHVDTIRERVLHVGRGGPVSAVSDRYRSLFGRGHTLVWEPTLDHETFGRYEAFLKSLLERDPEPGLVFADGRVVEGMLGERLDSSELWMAVKGALRGDARVRVQTRVTEPGPPRRLMSAADFQSLQRPPTRNWTRRYVTCYRAAKTGRRANIERAAMRLHGSSGRVIPPGGTLAFNALTGPRTLANGFAFATEVRNGKAVRGSECPAANPCIGGGVCQVAGTLHALAFFAGLEIEEHHAHTRLPRYRYLPPGLDAAVTWPAGHPTGGKDLVIRNPYPRPLLLEVSVDGRRLEVRLSGEIAPYRVDCCYEVEDERDGSQRIRRWRTVYKPSGPVRTDESKRYRDGIHGDPESWRKDGASCWQRDDDRPGCGPCSSTG